MADLLKFFKKGCQHLFNFSQLIVVQKVYINETLLNFYFSGFDSSHGKSCKLFVIYYCLSVFGSAPGLPQYKDIPKYLIFGTYNVSGSQPIIIVLQYIYPFFEKRNILRNPFHKLTLGGILAGVAFIASASLEIYLKVSISSLFYL